MRYTTGREAQRLALAEKLLSDHASSALNDGVDRIERHCRLHIGQVHITFRTVAQRGIEPRAHCVIVDADFALPKPRRAVPVRKAAKRTR